VNCFGLTDHPEQRQEALGNPADWRQRAFVNETKARRWEREMLAKPDYTNVSEGNGWQYGYTYSKSPEPAS